jgi:hypothetical protein
MPLQHPSNTTLGLALGRYANLPFAIKLSDRLLHFYVIGQTGAGKSTLLFNMARQDARHGIGFCLIEPHGDLSRQLANDLNLEHIFWDVSDPASPYGYNPLVHVTESLRPLVASGLIDTLKRQWPDAWGARMEHLLRYAMLALLEFPKADLRDIIRLFIEKEFRQVIISRIRDPQVRQFWTLEYPNMNYKTAIDGVAPIANKLGAFLAHPIVRKAVCEPQKPLRFRRVMDEGGRLVINLAKGALGADTANVLGGLLVSSLMHAAFTRQETTEGERRPFMLYVDEFHSFSSTAFASMLSETRKYGLGLTMAHQHTQQADAAVIEAVLGNVGSLMTFRLGVSDAPLFQRQLGNVSVSDLISLPNYRAYVQLMVDGQRSRTFSAESLPGI